VKKKKEMLMLLSRFICMRDFETPERNTPCMWPSLKTNDRLRSVLRSAFPGDVLREGGRGRMTNARRKKKNRRRIRGERVPARNRRGRARQSKDGECIDC
jgi:hypothetical protein